MGCGFTVHQLVKGGVCNGKLFRKEGSKAVCGGDFQVSVHVHEGGG